MTRTLPIRRIPSFTLEDYGSMDKFRRTDVKTMINGRKGFM